MVENRGYFFEDERNKMGESPRKWNALLVE